MASRTEHQESCLRILNIRDNLSSVAKLEVVDLYQRRHGVVVLQESQDGLGTTVFSIVHGNPMCCRYEYPETNRKLFGSQFRFWSLLISPTEPYR